jgi:hypothetical protein
MRHRLILSGFLLLAAAGAAADDFYDVRLRVGQEAYREKRYKEAAENLRIAVFGFLDRPALLTQALARLSLALEAAGRKDDADAVISRFVVVERQFSAYDAQALEGPVRSEFHALLQRRLPPETIRSMPRLTSAMGAARTP